MRNIKLLLSLAAIYLLTTACGTTLVADMEPDWQSDITLDNLGSVYIMNDGERIFVENNREAYVLDGNTGKTLTAMSDSFWESVVGNISFRTTMFGGLSGSTSDMIANAYSLIPLHHSGVVLLFDYRFDNEIIAALDMYTGEEKWKISDLNYSLGNYGTAVEKAATEVGKRLAGMIGGEHEEESDEERRDRQIAFMNKVIYPLQGEDAFFLKSFNGLLLIDAKTGDIKFSVDEFSGAGISDVNILENGDYLVVSGGIDLANLAVANGYHIARISPDGGLGWIAEHKGSKTGELLVSDNTVLVDGSPTEAFNLSDGKKLWDNDVRKGSEFHHILTSGNHAYFASDLEGRIGRVPESKVWKQDLRTGDIQWETDKTRNSLFHGMVLKDDVLLAYGNGRLFDGNRDGIIAYDANSGRQLWKTPEMRDTAGPVIDGMQVYYADSNRLYMVNLHTGDVEKEAVYPEEGIGRAIGIFHSDDQITVTGTEAVIAFDKTDGTELFHAGTEKSSDYSVQGQKLVLKREGEAAQVVNLSSGNTSPVMRHNTSRSRYYGDLDNAVFVNEDATYTISINREGRILRHSF